MRYHPSKVKAPGSHIQWHSWNRFIFHKPKQLHATERKKAQSFGVSYKRRLLFSWGLILISRVFAYWVQSPKFSPLAMCKWHGGTCQLSRKPHDCVHKKFLGGAGEMAKLVKNWLATRAWCPEFRPLARPHVTSIILSWAAHLHMCTRK